MIVKLYWIHKTSGYTVSKMGGLKWLRNLFLTLEKPHMWSSVVITRDDLC